MILLLPVLAVAIAGALYINSDFFRIDSCLDSGGCWDDTNNTCEFERPSACRKSS